jgi:leader peptidase (prepilin peptidase)/N-methyltransferase
VARLARWHYGEEALGQGDWKLAAMLGAFLGWRALMATVFFACFAGAVVGLALIALGRGSRRTHIPLGTFLGVAGIAAVFVAQPVVEWYRGLLNG